jgi:Phosphotransferase enzyme family
MSGFAGSFDEPGDLTVSIYPDLTHATACRALCEAGLSYPADALHIAAREERWAVSLPDGRIAWFPASEAGASRLTVERRVLGLLADRCSFRVPKVLFTAKSGFDLRLMVPEQFDPWGLYYQCLADSGLARRIGRSLGAILVEQHTRIVEADVAGWLPRGVSWPEPGASIRERLPRVVDDRSLVRRLEEVIDMFEGTRVETGDCTLVHGDLGLHNIATDPETDRVNGVFDYEGAAWADRHHDFRYLLLDIGREDMLDAALELYEQAIGQSLDRARIRLSNAACAIGFLAYRVGVPPEHKSCGRTLSEDLRWVRAALARLR